MQLLKSHTLHTDPIDEVVKHCRPTPPAHRKLRSRQLLEDAIAADELTAGIVWQVRS